VSEVRLTRVDLLALLERKAQDDGEKINVTAVRTLLEELRRDEAGTDAGSELDELDGNVTPIRRVG
jgi:hypothetical protein